MGGRLHAIHLLQFDGFGVFSLNLKITLFGIEVATAAKKRPGENEDGEDGPAKKRKPKAKAKGKSKSKAAKRVEDAKEVESKPASEKGEKVEDNLGVPIPSSSAPVLPPPCDAVGQYEDLWKGKEWVGVQIVMQVRKHNI